MTSPLESLENLAGPGKSLRFEKPDAAEYQGLLRSGGEYEGNLDVDERLVIDLTVACGKVLKSLQGLPAP